MLTRREFYDPTTFDVRKYGASPSASAAANTAAFQAAINAACLVNGTVYVPPANAPYLVNKLTMGQTGSYRSCAIVGGGYNGHYSESSSYGAVLKLADGTNDDMFFVPQGNASSVGPGPLVLEDIWLQGNRSNQSGSSSAINLESHTASADKQRGAFLRRVRISNFLTHGVRIGTLRNAGVMEQVAILDIGTGSTGSAIVGGSAADWRFDTCDFGVCAGAVVQDSGLDIASYTKCNFFNGLNGYKADTATGSKHFVQCSFDRNGRDNVILTPDAPVMVSFTACRFTIGSQAANNTYADVRIDDNPYVMFESCNFETSTATNKPARILDLNGTTTKGIGFVNCKIDSGAYVTEITQDTANLNTFGLNSFNAFRIIADPLDVNYLRVEGGNTGQAPSVRAAGDDTNIAFDFYSKGTSSIRFYTNNGNQLQAVVQHTANAVNYVTLAGGSTGNGPSISAAGSDTNVDLRLVPKGTGLVRMGYASSAAATPANFTADRYLAVKDSSGTTYYIPCRASTW